MRKVGAWHELPLISVEHLEASTRPGLHRLTLCERFGARKVAFQRLRVDLMSETSHSGPCVLRP